LIEATKARPGELRGAGLPTPRDGAVRSAADLLALDDIGFDRIIDLWPELATIPATLRPQIEADWRYAGYIDRQQADIDALRRDEAITIPADFDYAQVGGLSAEACDVMIRLRPETIGQANRLPGLTPAAVVAVLRHLKRQQVAETRSSAGDAPVEQVTAKSG
jgi:tRNA uridine 5-carboxymethylaminomethyl modification enzyme